MRSLFLISLLMASSVHAQQFTYPVLQQEVTETKDIVPEGWSVHYAAVGDLNGDNQHDAAFVLQYKDSVQVLKEEDGYTDTVITQPRILAILFKTAKGFRLMLQSNTFILPHDDPRMEDPFDGMNIVNRVLEIKFRYWYNIGTYYMGFTSYKFRYQDEDFKLIGADYKTFHRASHDYEDRSYNFLTKKRSVIKGNDNEDKKPTTEWGKINLPELKTFKTFTKPNTWEVEEFIYL